MNTPLPQLNWLDANYQQILKVLEMEPGLAIFDFDNTLIYNDLGEACMLYAALQGMLPGDESQFWQLLEQSGHLSTSVATLKQYYQQFKENDDEAAYLKLVDEIFKSYEQVYQQDGMEAAYRWSAILFAWHPVTEWQKISRHVLASEEETEIGTMQLPSGSSVPRGIRKYTEIYELIQQMLSRNWEVKIVTASPREIIAAVAPQWNLKAEDVIGMKLAQSSDARYLPEILDPMPFQAGKLEILYETLGMEVAIQFAAGDSLGDKDLLQAADTAILIDRAYPEMRKLAQDHDHIYLQPRFINPIR